LENVFRILATSQFHQMARQALIAETAFVKLGKICTRALAIAGAQLFATIAKAVLLQGAQAATPKILNVTHFRLHSVNRKFVAVITYAD
jgi:hypothetical protein